MFKLDEVKAHCDVPCGIYDPSAAQIAALSVIRMIDLMNTAEKGADDVAYHNDMARYVAVKETEAIKCKDEIAIIWGDFIKPPHLIKYPDLHTLAHKIMMLGGAAKQHASREKGMELLAAVNEFAAIFWEIKGVKTQTVTAPYAPSESVISPVL
ncbi:MAG: Nickel-dependent superoxide dismutase [uncultured Sulfurovum sp.]|uniref:Nickel-dependent superoxide dismutase n=1 Tax=uncultured Sulfurovum sp. TaxID=269237 RepID=A0A6S6RYU5_9BACT|nr:MAG: Nickel-dependent superoxide dismutase [uncultured Sulfurovum sp.]